MNSFRAINTDYLKPSRTIETVLVSNKKLKKVLFVYNYEGNSFRVFDNTISLMEFFSSNTESKYNFDSENKLDEFLSTVELE